MRRLLILALALSLAGAGLLPTTPLAAQAKPGAARVTVYDTATGLPDDRVQGLGVDPAGRVWVGTYKSGASVREDGSWRTLTAADGLADDDVRAFLFDREGRTWIGATRGLSVLEDGAWTRYGYADGMASSGVEALAQDAGGDIWAAHLAEGVSRFDGQAWRTYTVDDGLADNWVHGIVLAPDDSLWFATNAGVSRYDGVGWITFTVADGLPDDTVFGVAVDPTGQVWAATAAGLGVFDGERWRVAVPDLPFHAVAVDPAGRAWAVGGAGVWRQAGGDAWVQLLPRRFYGQDLRSVAFDGAGNAWIGSMGGGVTVLPAVPNPRPSSAVPAAAVTGDAPTVDVWVGTQQGAAHWDGRTWTRYGPPGSADGALAGLAGPDVRAIAQDAQGRLWFGTNAGISCLDGNVWTSYGPAPTSLRANDVANVSVGPDGALWFGYGERGLGLSRRDAEGQWQHFLADGRASPGEAGKGGASLPSGLVYATAHDAQGRTWAATARGVGLYDGATWTTFTTADGLPSATAAVLAVAPNGDVWVGTDAGAARYDGAAWTAYTEADGVPGGVVSAFAFAPDGTVWLGARPSPVQSTTTGGLASFDGQVWTAWPAWRTNSPPAGSLSGPADGPLGDWINALAVDRAGRLWVGAYGHALTRPGYVAGGVSVYDGKRWTVYTAGSDPTGSLPGDGVTTLAVTPDGAAWVATEQGLARFDGTRWQRFGTAVGLPSNVFTGLAVDAAGHLWATTWGGGVMVYDGVTWEFTTTQGLADLGVNALLVDPAGDVWAATDGGVSRFDGKTWTAYTVLDGLPSNRVAALALDATGRVWAGSDPGGYAWGGAARYRGDGLWQEYKLPQNNVTALATDAAGTLYAATYTPGQFAAQGGLARFAGDTWTAVQPAAGLIDDRALALTADPQGGLWFGTDGSYGSPPLLHWDGATWRASGPDQGLAAAAVLALAVDGTGALWVGTDRGLFTDSEHWTPIAGLAEPVQAVLVLR